MDAKALETWKAEEVSWNEQMAELRAKLARVTADRDALRARLERAGIPWTDTSEDEPC